MVVMTSPRTSLKRHVPGVYGALGQLDDAVALDPTLRELIRIRAPQVNGCSYCIDEHSSDARAAGESERRIWALAAWWHVPFFDARERAALALTDAICRLPQGGVPDALYAEAAEHFDEAELANVIGAIIAINAWNMIGVATGMQPAPEPAAVTS
jgi:AhpD family alkylhydroperoxidase